MAEALALGASVVAFMQLADRVIGLCKFYIETVRDAPHDLRVILIEISALRAILENLDFLIRADPSSLSKIIQNLGSPDGPLFACSRSLGELEKLFPVNNFQRSDQGALIKGQKRQKVTQILASLAWPLKDAKARKLLDEVLRYKTTITLALSTESSQDIKVLKQSVKDIQQILTVSQRERIYEWLEHTNPSELHNRACALRENDTGLWMLRSAEWNNWLSKKTRFVWIHGIPGAGKTVLASFLNQNILDATKSSRLSGFIYYYCYFGHNQDETAPFLRWVISQLCRQASHVPDSVLSMREAGREPSIHQLLAGLEEILAFFEGVYIVIDAVDESREPRTAMLSVLKTLATDPRFQRIQLLATSREYFDIESVLSSISVPVSMKIGLIEKDIRMHVHSVLRSNYRFSKWPDTLRDEVEDALAVGANGMFRWAVCQIDVLQRLKAINDIRAALKNLPETLDETYERIFDAIPTQERNLVQRTLCLLCGQSEIGGTYGSMNIHILLSMIFENWNHEPETINDQLCDADTLKDVCGCLITISKQSVTLAHFTVREFLFSVRLWSNLNNNIHLFALSIEIVRITFLMTTLRGAITYLGRTVQFVDSLQDLYDYLLFFGYFAVERWQSEIMKGQLQTLAFNFMDPFGRHFARLKLILEGRIPRSRVWLNAVPSQRDVAVLVHLLDKELVDLASIFLAGKDIPSLLQARVAATFKNEHNDIIFEGNLVELFDHFFKLHGQNPLKEVLNRIKFEC